MDVVDDEDAGAGADVGEGEELGERVGAEVARLVGVFGEGVVGDGVQGRLEGGEELEEPGRAGGRGGEGRSGVRGLHRLTSGLKDGVVN